MINQTDTVIVSLQRGVTSLIEVYLVLICRTLSETESTLRVLLRRRMLVMTSSWIVYEWSYITGVCEPFQCKN